MYKSRMLAKCLGSQGDLNTRLRYIPSQIDSNYMICHNEGTDHKDGTSPTIGHDSSKLCRDQSMSGYCVGTNIQD